MKIGLLTKTKRLKVWLRKLVSKTILGYISKLVVALLLLAIPPDQIYSVLQDHTHNLLATLWSLLSNPLPLKGSILQILAFFLIIWFSYQTKLFYSKWQKKKNLPYYFHSEEGLLWKVNKKTGEVDKNPYCPIHEAKLGRYEQSMGYNLSKYLEFILNCPYDHNMPVISIYRLDTIYEKTKAKIEAEFNKDDKSINTG